MKNDEIYNAAFFILDKFEWKKPQDITEEDNKKAYDTLQVVLNLFEKIDIERCNNERINYGIYYRLPNVERELEQKCWHNACHELRDFLQLEFRFEKRMLTDTVYVLKKISQRRSTCGGGNSKIYSFDVPRRDGCET